MSLGSNTNTYLSKLIETGSDAMSNLYYLQFSGSLLEEKYSDLTMGLRVRSKEFTPPTFSQSQKNTVHYMTTSVDLPISAITGQKELKFTFRLDDNYQVYKYLLEQQAITGVGNLGWANSEIPDSNNGGFKISVYVFNRSLSDNLTSYADPEDESCYQKLYEFNYCWIKDLSGLNFSYDNNTAMTITATVGFFEFDDPMNLLTSI